MKYNEAFGTLRSINESEVEIIRTWRNAPDVRKNMYTTHEISAEEHQAWWGNIKGSGNAEYLIYERGSGLYGVVGFTNINTINGNCSWAFYTSPNASKGTGSLMEYLALEYAFNKLKLHKLYCEVLSFNSAVIKMHEKFGFKVEGILKDQYCRDEEYVDVYRLGILQAEWNGKRSKMYEKLIRFLRVKI